MESFFGGQPGQSFSIKQVFTSYHTPNSNSIDADLKKGWTSPIQVGEFVVVAYGEPGTDDYNTYRNIDLAYDNKTHNWTLWRKAYDDTQTDAGGLYYELIGSMTGNTPKIVIETPATVLDVDQDPAVVTDMSNIDEPHIEFQLPQSQVLQYDVTSDFSVLDADEDPTFALDSSDINEPRIKVGLPQSQVIETAVIEEYLTVGSNPEVRLDMTEDGTVNSPVIKIKLPVAQELLEENVLSSVLDANVLPYITFDETDKNNPTLTFYLPQSQVMDEPTLVSIGPAEEPTVEDIGTVNSPKLQFSLPRAVQFYYGSLLGERTAGTYSLTNDAFSDYEIGDYYINAATGFVYKVTAKDGTTCTFEYMACIQSPLPTTVATGISPYTAEGELAAPEIVQTYTNSELTAWQLEFKLPKAAIPLLETAFVGSTEQAAASLSITSEDNYTISLTIPTGSKLFTGTEVTANDTSASIDGARVGDIYLNSSTGVVYTLEESGWVASSGNLKGPVGDTVKIIKDYDLSGAGDIEEQTVIDTIVADMGSDYEYSADELFKVRWTDTTTSTSTDYYFYKNAQGVWGNSQITGGVESLIQKIYASSASNKAYNVDYVNSLIGDAADTSVFGDDVTVADITAYSKSQVDSKVAAINESLGNVYTKDEVDAQVATLNEAITEATDALAGGVYTKAEIDEKETAIKESVTALEETITWGKFSDLISSSEGT